MIRTNKKNLQRTVPQELHEAWLSLRRKGDPEVMAKALRYSRPVIDRALIYGYCSLPELPDAINKFFKARLDKEKASARELMELSDQVKK